MYFNDLDPILPWVSGCQMVALNFQQVCSTLLTPVRIRHVWSNYQKNNHFWLKILWLYFLLTKLWYFWIVIYLVGNIFWWLYFWLTIGYIFGQYIFCGYIIRVIFSPPIFESNSRLPIPQFYESYCTLGRHVQSVQQSNVPTKWRLWIRS